jgi:hypothetical protein
LRAGPGKETIFLEPLPVIGYYLWNIGRCHVLIYKVVEVNSVTEDLLESVLNEWTAQGWSFDGMQFAMRESSKRPAMAFVIFTRGDE